jgi:hypothetical protein
MQLLQLGIPNVHGAVQMRWTWTTYCGTAVVSRTWCTVPSPTAAHINRQYLALRQPGATHLGPRVLLLLLTLTKALRGRSVTGSLGSPT